MCVSISPICMYVHHGHTWCPQRSEKGAESPDSGVPDGYEPPCGGWEPNAGPP